MPDRDTVKGEPGWWLPKVDAAFVMNVSADWLDEHTGALGPDGEIEGDNKEFATRRPEKGDKRTVEVFVPKSRVKRTAINLNGVVPASEPEPVPADDLSVDVPTGDPLDFGGNIGRATAAHIEEARRNSYWRGRWEERGEIIKMLTGRGASTDTG